MVMSVFLCLSVRTHVTSGVVDDIVFIQWAQCRVICIPKRYYLAWIDSSAARCGVKLKFHGSSFLVVSSGIPREDVRNKSWVSGWWNLENDTTHRQTGSTIHCSRPPADKSGKRVASWTGKSPDTRDILARILERMSGVSARMLRGSSQVCRACRVGWRGCHDATRMLRGNRSRRIRP